MAKNWLKSLDRRKLAELSGHRTIRAQIKTLRQLNGWTQEKLARRVGLARSSIANIESGHRTANPKNEQKIFRVLLKGV